MQQDSFPENKQLTVKSHGAQNDGQWFNDVQDIHYDRIDEMFPKNKQLTVKSYGAQNDGQWFDDVPDVHYHRIDNATRLVPSQTLGLVWNSAPWTMEQDLFKGVFIQFTATKRL